MKKIAIIGGNGFIGKNLGLFFSNQQYAVTLIGRKFSSDHLLLQQKNVEFVEVNVHQTDQLIGAVADSDYVIWLVHTAVPASGVSICDDFETNIAPVVQFLEQAHQLKNLSRFIYLSSGGTVYGNPEVDQPMKENHPKNPISTYGLSKLTIENYITFLSNEKHFQSVILRPSNVYGPYQNLLKPQGIIGFAFKSINTNSVLDLYDEGKVVRDFIHVKDLAYAIQKIIESPETSTKTEILNVGSGEGISIKSILDKIEIISGKKLQYQHKSSRNFDCQYSVLNAEQLKNKYCWEPKLTLEEGLQEVWQWIKTEKLS